MSYLTEVLVEALVFALKMFKRDIGLTIEDIKPSIENKKKTKSAYARGS